MKIRLTLDLDDKVLRAINYEMTRSWQPATRETVRMFVEKALDPEYGGYLAEELMARLPPYVHDRLAKKYEKVQK